MTKKNFKKIICLSSTVEQLFRVSLSILKELDESLNVWSLESKEIRILSIRNKNKNNMKSLFNKINDIKILTDKINTEAIKRAIPKLYVSKF